MNAFVTIGITFLFVGFILGLVAGKFGELQKWLKVTCDSCLAARFMDKK